MPAGNPFIHQSGSGGNAYVTESAENSVNPVSEIASAMPTHLALILVLAAGGLWALRELGFRFVVEAGRAGG